MGICDGDAIKVSINYRKCKTGLLEFSQLDLMLRQSFYRVQNPT